MDTNQWTQDIGGLKGIGEMASSTCSRTVLQERKVRPQKDQALNCPRCQSTNTKFCYYNNYSLTQPRYFCKTCRRYWTEGGNLRNVPVGGGSRKNKRSSTNTSTSSSQKLPDLNPPNLSHFASRNSKIHDGQDLNLAFPPLQGHYHGGASQFFELPKIDSSSNQFMSSSSSSSTSTSYAALELLRTGIVSRGLNSYISSTSTTPAPDLNALCSTSGFSFQDLKPGISFSVDNGLGSRFVPGGIQQNGGRLMLPFGVMKQFPSTNEVDQNKGQSNSNRYWNGMLGGGSW